MGAEFLELDVEEDGEGGGGYAKEMSPAFIEAEMALFAAQAKEVDIIITTALIPEQAGADADHRGHGQVDEARLGHRRPRGRAGRQLRAAPSPGQVVEAPRRPHHRLHRPAEPAGADRRASSTATTSTHLLADMGGARNFHIDLEDEVVRGALVLHDGELIWPPPQASRRRPPRTEGRRAAPQAARRHAKRRRAQPARRGVASARSSALVAAVLLIGLGLRCAAGEFLSHLTVFVLACFVGWQVVWNVTPALHTPLMSVTNAISGIIIVGGMLQVSGPPGSPIDAARRRARSCSPRSTSPAASWSLSACCGCSAASETRSHA